MPVIEQGLSVRPIKDSDVVTALNREVLPVLRTMRERANHIWDGVIDPAWYGAKGDGVTDDTNALQRALDAASGKVVDLGGRTYLVTSTLTGLTGTSIRRGTLDFSTAASSDTCLTFVGTEDSGTGTNWSLASNASAGDSTITLNDATGISAGDYLFLESDDIWARWSGGNESRVSEYVHVESVSGNTVTLYSPLLTPYATTDNAAVRLMSFVSDVVIEDLHIIGGNTSASATGQVGIDLIRCRNVQILGGGTSTVGYSGVQLTQCLDVVVRGAYFRKALVTGIAYGVAVLDGSTNTTVSQCYGVDLRHLVTSGGTEGTVRRLRGIGNIADDMREAGLDAHPGVDDVDFSHNTVSMADGASGTGIICQGARLLAVGNTLRNVSGEGIYFEPLQDSVARITANISNNDVAGNATSMTTGVLVGQPDGTADGSMASIVIRGNTIDKAQTAGIYVRAQTCDVSRVSVQGNNMSACAAKGVYLRADDGQTIQYVQVVGNIVESTGGADAECIYLQANGTNGTISDAIVLGNISEGGTAGLRVAAATSASAQLVRVRHDMNIMSVASNVQTGSTDPATGENWNASTWIKSGSTQVGAGAAEGELWITASHATLPDGVVMRGA